MEEEASSNGSSSSTNNNFVVVVAGSCVPFLPPSPPTQGSKFDIRRTLLPWLLHSALFLGVCVCVTHPHKLILKNNTVESKRRRRKGGRGGKSLRFIKSN